MKRSVLAGICLLLSAGSGRAVESLTLNSVRQVDDRPPKVRVYLDAPEAGALRRNQVAASLGQDAAEVVSVESFSQSGEGVATIFLVDVSRSLTADQFSGIQDAIDSWIDQFNPDDRGAIIAFGNESRLVVDFTSDVVALRAGLASLGPTASLTLLHQALADALELSRRQDPDLPGRRVIAVLTDGLDEGSGLALDDVLDRLRQEPVPIYTIGYSRLQPESRRKTYLEVLRRLSTNSGGNFFEARRSNFAESYIAIREAISRVWVVDIVCRGCRADGNRHRLQLTLTVGDKVLSEGTDVRLLPDPTKAPVDRAGSGRRPAESRPSQAPRKTKAARDDEAPPQTTPQEAGEEDPGAGTDPYDGEYPEEYDEEYAEEYSETGTELGQEPAPGGADPGEIEGEEKGKPTVSSWMYSLMAGLVLLLLVVILSGRRFRTGKSEGEGEDGEDGDKDEVAPAVGNKTGQGRSNEGRGSSSPELVLPTEPEIPPPPRPRSVRLVVVRGSRKGKEYILTLRGRAVLGSRSDCDCVLAEPGLSAQQFELFQDDHQVLLRNLATSNVTRMGGHAVTEARRVRSNDLVGTAEVILRVVLDP